MKKSMLRNALDGFKALSDLKATESIEIVNMLFRVKARMVIKVIYLYFLL